MSKMYMVIGAPGCGKSTYIQNHLKENEIVISRDKIRFSLLKDTDEYFSKEKEVYNEFIKQINAAIADNKDFYVDQTSYFPLKTRRFQHINNRLILQFTNITR